MTIPEVDDVYLANDEGLEDLIASLPRFAGQVYNKRTQHVALGYPGPRSSLEISTPKGGINITA